MNTYIITIAIDVEWKSNSYCSYYPYVIRSENESDAISKAKERFTKHTKYKVDPECTMICCQLTNHMKFQPS